MKFKYSILSQISKFKQHITQHKNNKDLSVFFNSLNFDKAYILYFDHSLGGGVRIFSNNFFKKNSHKEILQIQYYPKKFIFRITEVRTGQSVCFSSLSQIEKYLIPVLWERIIVNNLVGYASINDVFACINKIKKQSTLHVYVHDYFCLCPKYILLNENNIFCKLPKHCESCYQKYFDNHKLLKQEKEFSSLAVWQKTWQDFLEKTDTIFVASQSSLKLIAQTYPSITQKIIINPLDTVQLRKAEIPPHKGLHIGIIGTVSSIEKGKFIIKKLAEESKAYSDIKIFIIGKHKKAPKNIAVHGEYKQEELPDLMEKYAIDIVFFPSVCAETFSFVCSEAISMNLPLACFDIGAQAEKAKNYEKGIIISTIKEKNIISQLLLYTHTDLQVNK